MARNNRKGKGAGLKPNQRMKKHLLYVKKVNRIRNYLNNCDSKIVT